MIELLKKLKNEPLFHISKRSDIEKWKAWVIRLVAGVIALFVCIIVASIFTKDFGGTFASLFIGVFGTERRIITLVKDIAILLCIALAVTPAFKMKFWNIGAEGQVIMGALMAIVCVQYLGSSVPNAALIFIMLIASVLGGAIWGVIPAIFKAKWNTNETLFTLMMNYVAIQLVSICINSWDKSGHAQYGSLTTGVFPSIGGNAYVINILIAVVMTIAVFIYLRFSKHGYELTVVGESINTAKYIGINVKKVILRTMLVSGALCGIVGLMIVSGDAKTITTTVVNGRGFTAILVSWLAHFSPVGMIFTSFLVVFLQQGARNISIEHGLGSTSFADMFAGIFLFFIIACEFFINYQIKFNTHKKHSKHLEIITSGENDNVENDAISADEKAQNSVVTDELVCELNDADAICEKEDRE